MRRPGTMSPFDRAPASRFAPLLLPLLCAAGLDEAAAAQQRLIVTDLVAEPDLRREADTLSVLVRASLNAPAHPVVNVHSLARAIERLAPDQRSRYALVVRPDRRVDLARALRAKHVVAGQVERRGSRLRVSVVITSLRGRQTTEISGTMRAGRQPQLAFLLAQKISRALRLSPAHDLRNVAPADVLPFAAALSALRERDLDAAARALEIANPELAPRLLASEALVRAVVDGDSLSPPQKILAALALAKTDRAVGLARTAHANAPSRTQGREALAALGLALAAHGDQREARRALRRLGRGPKEPLAQLALAELARAHSRRNNAERPLIGLVRTGNLSALARVARLPRNHPSPDLLRAATRAVQQLEDPLYDGLKTTLGLRAALRAGELGLTLDQLLPLLDSALLPSGQGSALRLLAEEGIASGSALGFRLSAELASREGDSRRAVTQLTEAMARGATDQRSRLMLARSLIDLDRHDEALATLQTATAPNDETRLAIARALALSGQRPQGSALRKELDASPLFQAATAAKIALDDGQESHRSGVGLAGETDVKRLALAKRQLQEATERIRGMLRAFSHLTAGGVSTIALVRYGKQGRLPLWPLAPAPDQLRRALRNALSDSPYGLAVSTTDRGAQELSSPDLSALAARLEVDALMLYDVSARGLGHAKARLILYLVSQDEAFELAETTAGLATGLVRWDRQFITITIALLLLGVSWFGYTRIRGYGEINVSVALDPEARREQLTLLINRSARTPLIKDPARYAAKLRAGSARQSSSKATRVHKRTRFRRVPAGKRYVHLIGTYEKDGNIQLLPENLTRQVQVERGQVAQVVFDLEPQSYLLQLSVYDDDQPIRGAAVYLGDDESRQQLTSAAGSVALRVQRAAEQLVHVRCGEIHISRALQFDDTKTHSITINLAKERRLRELSGGVSIANAPLGTPVSAVAGLAQFDEIELPEHEDATAPQSTSPETNPQSTSPAPDAAPHGETAAEQSADSERDAGPQSASAQGGTVLAWGANAPKHAVTASTGDPGNAPKTRLGRQGPSSGGLARYQPIAELGRGAMGIVHRALDRVLEREVALKVVGHELRRHPVALKLFQQEAKALAALNHPNVVMVFDQGQDGDNTYMVMEFVEGRTLEQILDKEGPLTLELGLALAEQLCAGLSYAHARQIIHRDIKPDNVFVTPDGHVKLGDFGLARVIRELSIQKTEVRGTPLYMAPEQIRGTDIDFRADIYSLGCTLYATFTGRPPFVDGEILYHHLHTPPPAPSEIAPELPSELGDVLLRCVAKDKNERFSSVGELQRRIASVRQRAA
jgi:predicted Ser/Thr protein kinase